MKRGNDWNFDTASADGLCDRLSKETDIYIIDFDSVFGEEDHFGVMQEDTEDVNGEVPQDIRAFFGHPLTAATASVNGTEDNSASALALLHEYQNLPAIDKSDIKIGDRYEIADILRSDFRKDNTGSGSDGMMLLATDVDTFLSCDQVPDDISIEDNLHQDVAGKLRSGRGSPCDILCSNVPDPVKCASDDSAAEFSAFDAASDAEALILDEDMKSDMISDVTSAGSLPLAESITGMTVDSHPMNGGDMMWQLSQVAGQSPPVGSLSNNHLRAALSAPAPPANLLPKMPAKRRRPDKQRQPARVRSAGRATRTQVQPTPYGSDLMRGLATVANGTATFCPPLSSFGSLIDIRHTAPSSLPVSVAPTATTDGSHRMPQICYYEKPLLKTASQRRLHLQIQHDASGTGDGELNASDDGMYLSAAGRHVSMPLMIHTRATSPTGAMTPTHVRISQQHIFAEVASHASRPYSQPNMAREPFSYENLCHPSLRTTKSHSELCSPHSTLYENMSNFTHLQTAENYSREHADSSHPVSQPFPVISPRYPFPPQTHDRERMPLQSGVSRADTSYRHPCSDLRPSGITVASMTTNTLTYGARVPNTELAMSSLTKFPLSLCSATIAPTTGSDPCATAHEWIPSVIAQNQHFSIDYASRLQSTGPPPNIEQSEALSDVLPRAHYNSPPPRYPPAYAPRANAAVVPHFAVPPAIVPPAIGERMPPPEMKAPPSPEQTGINVSSSSHDDDDEESIKPSESTKRIIKALTEKIRRNQRQRQTSGEQDASVPETNSVIHRSLDGHSLGDALDNGDESKSSEPSPRPAVCVTTTTTQPWSAMPARAPADAFQQWAKTSGAPSGQPFSQGAAAGNAYGSMDVKRVVVIKPQKYRQQNGSVRSPDSGFNENCISPPAGSTAFSSDAAIPSRNDSVPGQRHRSKRRRPSSALKQPEGPSRSKRGNLYIAIPKREDDITGYSYSLESPISTNQRVDEDRMTYLNKGQFYGLVLQHRPSNGTFRCNTVKSVISVVFRDEKSVSDSLQLLDFWHSRQHSAKQRILDIDTKNCTGVLANCVDEIANNAVAIRWSPREHMARVSIAINCLSTDFSNQKGVKGLSLQIQIDSFEDSKGTTPVHRGYCQVKIFCDKGAERKTRDEERRKELTTRLAEARSKCDDQYHTSYDRSDFYSMLDLTTQPVLFNPVPDYEDYCITGLGKSHSIDQTLQAAELRSNAIEGVPPAKRQSLYKNTFHQDRERVLLYVREDHESVFTALLLRSPSMDGLTRAIEEKYNIQSANIRNIYKRSYKGVLVRMDDNIIEHYSNEATFIITIKKSEETHESQLNYDVILAEIDAN